MEEIEKYDREPSGSYSQWNTDIQTDFEGRQRFHFGGSGCASSGAPSYSYSRSNPQKAKLWYKQAVEDFRLSKNITKKKQNDR